MKSQQTKSVGAFTELALVIFIVVLGCSSANSPRNPQGDSRLLIKHVEGTAEISGAAGTWSQAREGDTIQEGLQARTGANGKIDFDLGTSGGVLTLMPESLLHFEQLGPVRSGSDVLAILDLRDGRVIGDTLKLPPRQRIVVKTRTGSYEIR